MKCICIKKDGNKCTYNAKPNSKFCGIHIKKCKRTAQQQEPLQTLRLPPSSQIQQKEPIKKQTLRLLSYSSSQVQQQEPYKPTKIALRFPSKPSLQKQQEQTKIKMRRPSSLQVRKHLKKSPLPGPQKCPAKFIPIEGSCKKGYTKSTIGTDECCYKIPEYSDEDMDRMNQRYELLPNKVKYYLTQTSSKAEHEKRIKDYMSRGRVVVDEIVAKRKGEEPWKSAKNKKTWSGIDIHLYSPDQLININNYLFDYGDLWNIYSTANLNRLPFPEITGKKWHQSDAERIQEHLNKWEARVFPYPLDQVLEGITSNNKWCPSMLANWDWGLHEYLYVNTDYPMDKHIGSMRGEVDYNRADFMPFTRRYTYHVALKTPQKVGDIHPSNIEKITLIRDTHKSAPQSISGPINPITDMTLLQALDDFHNVVDLTKGGNRARVIPSKYYSKFDKKLYKEPYPQKLYRGLSLERFDPHTVLDDTLHVGDTFELTGDDRVSSWTPDLCTAEIYAQSYGGKGIVVSGIIMPDDIIIDSRAVSPKEIQEMKGVFTMFIPSQSEILVKPGSYQITIEKITDTVNGKLQYYKHRRSDIVSLSNWAKK